MITRIFIIIIWHQAGGRDDSQTYYTWNDEVTEAAKVFDSYKEAQDTWRSCGMNEIHAGFIIECSPKEQVWI